MPWIWQQPGWPEFTFEAGLLEERERLLLHGSGLLFGAFRHLGGEDRDRLVVDLISSEALKTSEIEGEFLDRDSVQSSILRHFGLKTDGRRIPPAEAGVAELMMDLYRTHGDKLEHETLFRWHRQLMTGRTDLVDMGRYRTGEDPMQIVSGSIYEPKVHFEAPPSEGVKREMDRFVKWFNQTAPSEGKSLPALTRAGTAHLYFECIHPFEDGNGRIGRALAEKVLAQALGQPTLIALATIINRNRKAYSAALEEANKKLDLTAWLVFFADIIIEAMRYSRDCIEFLIEKAKLFDRLRGELNPRQEKCLLRMFREGPEGFEGGLSAENYIRITKTSRPTATRDLADLVKKGALTRTGERKSTRYHLKVGG